MAILNLPDPIDQEDVVNLVNRINNTFVIIQNLQESENNLNIFIKDYKNLHTKVRKIERQIIKNNSKIEKLKKNLKREEEFITQQKIEIEIIKINKTTEKIKKNIPDNWLEENKRFKNILLFDSKLKLQYNKNVDSSYNDLIKYITLYEEVDDLANLSHNFNNIFNKINSNSDKVIEEIKRFEKQMSFFAGTNKIKKYLSKARKKIKKNFDKKNDALNLIKEAEFLFNYQINWRKNGKDLFLNSFKDLEKISRDNFGLRKQKKLNKEQAIFIASCRAIHKDISLNF